MAVARSTPAVDPGLAKLNSPQRRFVPSNREDALQLLTGLGFSLNPEGKFTALPERDGKIPIIQDGLRRSESTLLERGLATRFPVLIEILAPDERLELEYIRWQDIKQLVFRAANEVGEFTSVPIAELDTKKVKTIVDASLFDLPETPRFRTTQHFADAQTVRAHVADRVAGAIASVAAAVKLKPDLRDAALNLLGTAHSDVAGHGLLTDMVRFLIQPETQKLSRQQIAVVQGYEENDGRRGRALIEDIFQRLRDSSAPPEVVKSETRWLEISREIFDNTRELSSIPLDDTKSKELRSALLAAKVDDVDALISFADLDTPVGPVVLVLASFLMGLRSGLCASSWGMKLNAEAALSELQAHIVSTDTRHTFDPSLFKVVEVNRNVGPMSALAFAGHTLFEFKGPLADKENAVEPKVAHLEESGADSATYSNTSTTLSAALVDAANKLGLSAAPSSATEDQSIWRDYIRNDARPIQICSKEEGRYSKISLRRPLVPPKDKSKPKTLLEANARPGLLWRLAVVEKQTFAVLDLKLLDLDQNVEGIWSSLESLEAEFSKLPKTKSPSKPRKKKVSPATEPQLNIELPDTENPTKVEDKA